MSESCGLATCLARCLVCRFPNTVDLSSTPDRCWFFLLCLCQLTMIIFFQANKGPTIQPDTIHPFMAPPNFIIIYWKYWLIPNGDYGTACDRVAACMRQWLLAVLTVVRREVEDVLKLLKDNSFFLSPHILSCQSNRKLQPTAVIPHMTHTSHKQYALSQAKYIKFHQLQYA